MVTRHKDTSVAARRRFNQTRRGRGARRQFAHASLCDQSLQVSPLTHYLIIRVTLGKGKCKLPCDIAPFISKIPVFLAPLLTLPELQPGSRPLAGTCEVHNAVRLCMSRSSNVELPLSREIGCPTNCARDLGAWSSESPIQIPVMTCKVVDDRSQILQVTSNTESMACSGNQI